MADTMSSGNDVFDPFAQSIIILGGDGVTQYSVSVADIDAWQRYCISTSVNYGSQIGASLIMLIVMLSLTPFNKLRQATGAIHVVHLVINIVRMILLVLYFTGDWVEFYIVWTEQFNLVGDTFIAQSIAGNAVSALLVVVMQAALSMQAWAMVKLWPRRWKWVFIVLSVAISLAAVALRLVYAVLISKATVERIPVDLQWIAGANAIYAALDIAYFCALFNGPLVVHLVRHKGVLGSRGGLSPMEVLIASNGILMFVPLVFAALEWGQFTGFEPASLTTTSVAIILPLGGLVAQRVSLMGSRVTGSSQGSNQTAGITSATPFVGYRGLNSGASSRFGTVSSATRVDSTTVSKERAHGIDGELERMERGEECRVRVDRTFHRLEEKV